MRPFRHDPWGSAAPVNALRHRTLRGGGRWQRFRARWLMQHPTCACGLPAEEVHHTTPVAVDSSRVFDWSNLESVCGACHRMRHGVRAEWKNR